MNPADLVLFIDESLLVANKPAGLPVLPDGYNPKAPFLRGVLEPAFGRLWIIHRLDRATSGLVVLARTAEAHRSLNTQFEKRQVSKIYHALVAGDPPWEEWAVDLPLRPDGDRRHRTIVDRQNGKPAITNFRVLERFERYALIEANPETGRTHQIRVHLASQGTPIVADALYGNPEGIYSTHLDAEDRPASSAATSLLNRLGLHAWSLNLQHPLTRAPVLFAAPYPPDFELTLRRLREHHRSTA